MICEEEERTTFEVRPEVEDSRVGCLEFTVECRIMLLGRRKFGSEFLPPGRLGKNGSRK